MKSAVIWAILIGGYLIVGYLEAQDSPQNAVRHSYAECPPEMAFDPKKSYLEFSRLMGPIDKPIRCWEIVDQFPGGGYCQVAFRCEDST